MESYLSQQQMIKYDKYNFQRNLYEPHMQKQQRLQRVRNKFLSFAESGLFSNQVMQEFFESGADLMGVYLEPCRGQQLSEQQTRSLDKIQRLKYTTAETANQARFLPLIFVRAEENK
ncbi:Hypothetical_protein [Hexamita inflata]|uniref:Hypothetical_protein n=1 Tax=Hexamita inflata TaxID=28002 RepID=A0AA86QA07_9EUKA|nr:Hypothetical protein HINF_LOCUS42934 [Hexamita inflata]